MVTAYKWSLRKGGAKMICPQCGQKRFVPFVLTSDNKTMAGEDFGRCDREQSCGYFRYPDKEAKATVEVEPRPELPPAAFALRRVWPPAFPLAKNTLFAAFRDLVGHEKLNDAFYEYKIGTGFMGQCIYPQYDGDFVRTAKAIMYDESGHRLKNTDGEALPVYWLHKSTRPDIRDYMEGHQLRQCFFGQHLLKLNPRAEVWVVEAEKTAVLMAATDDRTDRVWLACGGSQMLKGAIDLECLSGRDVTLVPDDGQFWNWKRIADAHGWKCMDISTIAGQSDWFAGCDIWDLKEKAIKNVRQWK